MPEGFTSLPAIRCGALEEFFLTQNPAPESSKSECGDRRTPSIRINGDQPKARKPQADVNGRSTKTRGRSAKTKTTTATAEPPPPKPPSRKPGSSIYYGVRFRPDLNKWVAEIRVAEWKAVDKKVWLGTFDTEEGAARGVDLARKLLKCKKKHGYNLPCPELEAYSGQIPSDLVLTDVTTNSMFKAATVFIKRECQEYAASIHSSATSSNPQQKASLLIQQSAPMPAIMGSHFIPSQANSLDSEVLDQDMMAEYSDSDSSIMLGYYDSISIDDYLEMTVSELGESPSSITSCITFEQACVDEMSIDCGPIAKLLPDAGFTRTVTGAVQCGMQGAVSQGGMQGEMQGLVSQADQCAWPGSSAALAPLPELYCGMTSYMPYVDSGYPTFMDCDDLLVHSAYYPFQHSRNGWC